MARPLSPSCAATGVPQSGSRLQRPIVSHKAANGSESRLLLLLREELPTRCSSLSFAAATGETTQRAVFFDATTIDQVEVSI